MTEKSRIGLRIPKDILDQFKMIAQNRGISVNALIINILWEWLKKEWLNDKTRKFAVLLRPVQKSDWRRWSQNHFYPLWQRRKQLSLLPGLSERVWFSFRRNRKTVAGNWLGEWTYFTAADIQNPERTRRAGWKTDDGQVFQYLPAKRKTEEKADEKENILRIKFRFKDNIFII